MLRKIKRLIIANSSIRVLCLVLIGKVVIVSAGKDMIRRQLMIQGAQIDERHLRTSCLKVLMIQRYL